MLLSFYNCRVTFDNNCLYNSASIHLFGNESAATVLKLLRSIELVSNSDYYAKFIREIVKTKNLTRDPLGMIKTAFSFEPTEFILSKDN